MSPYQLAKLELLRLVPISRDLAHVTVGLLLLGAFVLCSRFIDRKRRHRWILLLPTVTAAFIGELIDAFDALSSSHTDILGPALRDLATTTIPAACVLAMLIGWDRRKGRIDDAPAA